MSDITKKDNEQFLMELSKIDSSIFGSKDNTNMIITRGTEEKFMELKTLTNTELTEIANYMPEINRATNAFGKTQSQYMNYCMTLSSHAPIRNLRQIMSEVERRRSALKENTFKLKTDILKLLLKQEELFDFRETINRDDKKDLIKEQMLQVKIEKLETTIADARLYVEGALKTIYGYMQAYTDIMKKYDVDPNWDEATFEEAEEEHHIKKAFQQAHADIISTGRIGQGNHEYMWQCGINPQSALNDLMRYINMENEKYNASADNGVLSEKKEPRVEIDSFIGFLNTMFEKYKGSSRKILEMKGVNADGYYSNSVFRDINQKMDV